MKNISEKNYYIISLLTILVIILISFIIVRIQSRSMADVAAQDSAHLPETVSVETDSSNYNPIDEIDIFAKEDKE